MGFKDGDKVRATKSCSGSIQGNIYIVKNGYLGGTNCCCDKSWELVEEYSQTDFKIGDKVKFINNDDPNMIPRYYTESSGISESLIKHGTAVWDGNPGEIVGISGCYLIVKYTGEDRTMQLGFRAEDLVLVSSNSLGNTTMEKKVYRVLVVNKKTGNVDKNEVVTAESENSAILKAFGVSIENVYIKTTEEGKYEEEKPVNAVLVKEK